MYFEAWTQIEQSDDFHFYNLLDEMTKDSDEKGFVMAFELTFILTFKGSIL